MKLLLILLLSFPSHASFKDKLKAWCRANIVADDPYQYEESHTGWLIEEYKREGIYAVWNKKTSLRLYLLGMELRRREPTDEIDMILERYQIWEEK